MPRHGRSHPQKGVQDRACVPVALASLSQTLVPASFPLVSLSSFLLSSMYSVVRSSVFPYLGLLSHFWPLFSF